jgi:hypothetical protein
MSARVAVPAAALLLALLALSCSTPVYREVYPTLSDGQYDSEFPYRGCSKQLEAMGETVKMVSCIAYYKSFSFTADERIRLVDITDMLLASHDRRAVFVNSSTSGTATVIGYDDHRVLMLTCAHVVSFQDTTITFHTDGIGRPTPYLKSIGFKTKQVNYVAVFPEGGEMEILAVDRAADLAILGRRFAVDPTPPVPVFSYPLGKARDLEWGSFVYLFGYPSGYRMVTKGIVSSPNKDRHGAFLLDAVFSRGFSGGIALGIRDGIPNFELVGIVRAVSAKSSFILTPRLDGELPEFDPTVPYTGDVYVERKTEIEYGIIQAVPAELVRSFLDEQSGALAARGYHVAPTLLGRVEHRRND